MITAEEARKLFFVPEPIDENVFFETVMGEIEDWIRDVAQRASAKTYRKHNLKLIIERVSKELEGLGFGVIQYPDQDAIVIFW